jgi:hypothetical protein
MNRSMDDTQTTGPTTDEMPAAQTPAGEDPPNGPTETYSDQPGFSERGRMRRRMRFLRKARELAYRDLGGLVFDLHRFGRRNDALVLAKLETIGRIDGELRALQDTLAERRPVTVLREAGVAACPRCAAIHGSDDRFCPNCGLAMDLRAERPMAGPQSAVQTSAPAPPAPAPAMAPTTSHAPAPALPTSGEAPPGAPAGDALTTVTPAPGSMAAPAAPTTATSAPAVPAPSSAPPATATPAPATPTPRTPTPTTPPAPTTARPAPAPAAPTPRAPMPAPTTARPTPADAPAPAQDDTPPAGPAPAVGDGPPEGEERSNVDQPTEIVRPPDQNP